MSQILVPIEEAVLSKVVKVKKSRQPKYWRLSDFIPLLDLLTDWRYEWAGEKNNESCILAVYYGHRNNDNWYWLGRLESRGIINREQRHEFWKAITKFDHATEADEKDLAAINRLADILGIEVKIES